MIYLWIIEIYSISNFGHPFDGLVALSTNPIFADRFLSNDTISEFSQK